jgi:arylsulfatase A-like enzyme
MKHKFIILFLILLNLANTGHCQNKKGYNVLFIAVDDLRPSLGCYGDEQIHSPNIDRLADRALQFNRAYVQQAVCGPSRASLLTGLRPDTSTITGNTVVIRDRIPNIITLPQQFMNHGYRTLNFGKIFHGNRDTYNDLPSWSERPWYPPQTQTNNTRGYVSYRNLEILTRINKNSDRLITSASFWEAEDVPDNVYMDGAIVEKVADTMYRLKDLEEPFFLAVGIEKPHLPFVAPKKYWDLYDRTKLALPDNYFPTVNETEYTSANWADFSSYYDSPTPETITPDIARLAIHGYYACVSYADALVGKLLQSLDDQGLTDNTIVVLWGDHGWKLGEHFMWSKSTNYEIDTRAPLLIAFPGNPAAGRKTDGMVEFLDIYPTLCELAGLPLPDHLEGKSFLPLFENPHQDWKEVVFSQYPREGGQVMGYAMKTDDYRYVRWQDQSSGKVLARELYDHRKDYQENFNIPPLPENRQLIKKLDSQFERAYKAAHKPYAVK